MRTYLVTLGKLFVAWTEGMEEALVASLRSPDSGTVPGTNSVALVGE
jgi:hypothetical protein